MKDNIAFIEHITV